MGTSTGPESNEYHISIIRNSFDCIKEKVDRYRGTRGRRGLKGKHIKNYCK